MYSVYFLANSLLKTPNVNLKHPGGKHGAKEKVRCAWGTQSPPDSWGLLQAPEGGQEWSSQRAAEAERARLFGGPACGSKESAQGTLRGVRLWAAKGCPGRPWEGVWAASRCWALALALQLELLHSDPWSNAALFKIKLHGFTIQSHSKER